MHEATTNHISRHLRELYPLYFDIAYAARKPAPPHSPQFVAVVTRDFPEEILKAQALASQNYWQRVLANVALGPSSPYNGSKGFEWLSDATTVKEATSKLSGLTGVAAGAYTPLNYYKAMHITKDTDNPAPQRNPDLLYHLPSVRVGGVGGQSRTH